MISKILPLALLLFFSLLLTNLSAHKLIDGAKLAESIPADVSPALSAILLECPKQKLGVSTQDIPCESQLLVSIRVNPSFNTNAAEKFLILDEVYDPVRQTKSKILSPYLIQIKRSEPVIMYPLQFTKSLKVKQKAPPPTAERRQPVAEENDMGRPFENLDIKMEQRKADDMEGKQDWQERLKNVHESFPQLMTDANRADVGLDSTSAKPMPIENRKPRKIRDLTSQVLMPGNEEYASYYDEPQLPELESESAALRNEKANTHFVPFVKKSTGKKTNNLHSLGHLGLIQYVKDSNTSHMSVVKQPNSQPIRPMKSKEDAEKLKQQPKKLQQPTAADTRRGEELQKSYNHPPPTPPASKQRVAAKVEGKNLHYNKNLAVGVKNKPKQNIFKQSVKSENVVTQQTALEDITTANWLSKYDNSNNNNYYSNKSNEVFFKAKFGIDEPVDTDAQTNSLQQKRIFENQYRTHNDIMVSNEDQNAEMYRGHVSEMPIAKSRKTGQSQGSAVVDVEKQTLPFIESSYEWAEKPHNRKEEKPDKQTDDREKTRYDILRLYNQKLFANKVTPDDNHFLSQTMKTMIKPYPQARYFFNKEMQKSRDFEINHLSTERPLQKSQFRSHHLSKPKTYTQDPTAEDAETESTDEHTKAMAKRRKYKMGLQSGVERLEENPIRPGKSKGTPHKVVANQFEESDITTLQCGKKINNWIGNDDYDQQADWECTRMQGSMPSDKSDYENDGLVGMGHEEASHALAVLDDHRVPDDESAVYSSVPQQTVKLPAKSALTNVNYKPDFRDEKLNMIAFNNRLSPYSTGSDQYKIGVPPVFKYGPEKKHQIVIKPYRYYESLKPPQLPKIKHEEVKKPPSYLDFVKPSQLEIANLADKSNQKRSYLIYDDLDLEDVRGQSDYTSTSSPHDKLAARVALGTRPDDAQPCDSCGGKNKKPPPDKPGFSSSNNENSFAIPERQAEEVPCNSCGGKNKKVGGGKPGRDSFGNVCDCLNNPTVCECEGSKLSRSVPLSTYSVFNMSVPLPFLTTKLRIYRKRQKSWWRIIPEVTLNTLSGIFANGDLSVLFSSHVDILQLEKSMCLQNHQLLIPSKDKSARQAGAKEVEFNTLTLNMNPRDIFATDSTHIDFSLLNELSGSIKDEIAKDQPFSEDFAIWYKLQDQFMQSSGVSSKSGVTPIADLGYFPTSMNVLERCPNDNERLCLNMLDDRVPAYMIKMKMPFRENVVIRPNVLKVKISRIITDATTKDALQVSIDVINKGFEARPFFISVQDCSLPNAEPMQTAVQKLLLPYIAETVTFLLPLILQTKGNHKRFSCNVVVSCTPVDVLPGGGKTKRSAKNNSVVVAIRQMDAEPQARCFCIWKCKCHCMSKLESHVDFNVCEKMSSGRERDAGLLLNCPPGDESEDVCLLDRNLSIKKLAHDWGICHIMSYVLKVILGLLILGLIKAMLGLCFNRINRCCYACVQPRGSYDGATRCRRFFVNLLFFLMLPFLCWCKCFTPSNEDLMVASSEWQSKPNASKKKYSSIEDDDDDEDVIYSRRKEKKRCKKRLFAGDELTSPLAQHAHNFSDDDEDGNTTFILKALEESRQSLERMVNSMSSAKSKDVDLSMEEEKKHKAEEFVRQLKSARIVYRTLNESNSVLQNVPDNVKYCIQGYFLPSDMDYYEYISPSPLTQYIGIASDGYTVLALHPAIQIDPGAEFSRKYANKLKVYEAADLSILPPRGVPCINGTNFNMLESSLDKLTAIQQSRSRLVTSSDEKEFCVKNISSLPILDKSSDSENKPQLQLPKIDAADADNLAEEAKSENY